MFTRTSEIDELRAAVAAAQKQVAQLESERFTGARIDAATGVHTLAAFRDAAATDVRRARRSGAPLALAIFEIDELRALGAAHGAAAADRALPELAALLRADRRIRLLGRTGHGELAAVLPVCELDEAVEAAEAAVRVLSDRVVPGLGLVTASAGVAPAPRGIGLDALFAAAGDHLALAQMAGGNCARSPLQGADDSIVRVHQGVIDALARSLTQRDAYTGAHSHSVVVLVQTVAEGLGLDAAEVERISAAALLHDIGKVAIPDAILHKPDELSPREWMTMREHPVIGERMLRAVPGLGAIARIVRHEHERWDGGGYPDGLSQSAIPIGSRIILACDAFHAMTSDRPYRRRMQRDDALSELSLCAGTQFDPDVTEVLIGSMWHALQVGVA